MGFLEEVEQKFERLPKSRESAERSDASIDFAYGLLGFVIRQKTLGFSFIVGCVSDGLSLKCCFVKKIPTFQGIGACSPIPN